MSLRLSRQPLLLCILKLAVVSGVVADEQQSVEGEAADRSGEKGFRALYIMDDDGSNVRFLAAAPGMISSSSPEFSRDGKMIAFDAVPQIEEFQQSKIFIYYLDGPSKGQFKDIGFGNVPTWSPDGHQIAFMLNSNTPTGEEWGTWMMDSDGSKRRRLCSGWYPRWSSDGKSICVLTTTERPSSLKLYDVKSGESRKLLGDDWTVANSGGSWSADGKRVAFIGTRDGKMHLAIAEVDAKEPSVGIVYTESDPERRLIGPPAWCPTKKQLLMGIQKLEPPDADRSWQHTFVYSIHSEMPTTPSLFEKKQVGRINRSMTWSPDGRQVVFSSER